MSYTHWVSLNLLEKKKIKDQRFEGLRHRLTAKALGMGAWLQKLLRTPSRNNFTPAHTGTGVHSAVAMEAAPTVTTAPSAFLLPLHLISSSLSETRYCCRHQ